MKPIKRILVPTDGSDVTKKAVDTAIGLVMDLVKKHQEEMDKQWLVSQLQQISQQLTQLALMLTDVYNGLAYLAQQGQYATLATAVKPALVDISGGPNNQSGSALGYATSALNAAQASPPDLTTFQASADSLFHNYSTTRIVNDCQLIHANQFGNGDPMATTMLMK